MAGSLQPLDDKFAIVGPDGRPTLYFIKWAQQRQIDISGGITEADLIDYLAAHTIHEGVGIQITPSGNLTDGPVIAADVQEILDQITSTRGSIIYRGLLGWAALLPGTAGNVLSTNGAGADPTWIAPGGGGGAWTLAATTVIGASVASVDFTGLTGTEFLVICRNVVQAVSGVLVLRASTDNGATYRATSGDYVLLATTGVESNQTSFGSFHSTNATAARSGVIFLPAAGVNGGVKTSICYTAAQNLLFVQSTSPINALRVLGSAGNVTAGTVYVYQR